MKETPEWLKWDKEVKSTQSSGNRMHERRALAAHYVVNLNGMATYMYDFCMSDYCVGKDNKWQDPIYGDITHNWEMNILSNVFW